MTQNEDSNKIEELKEGLYSRNSPDVRTRRRLRFTDIDTNVPKDWGEEKEEVVYTPLNTKYEDHSMSFFAKLLIGSILFCVIAVGIGAYLFFNGSNLISANNIDIAISGPVSVPGGEPVSFDINVTNKNNVDLDLVDMAVNFPTGSTNPQNPSQELKVYRELLGEIPAGASVKKSVSAIIFGEENLQKSVVVDISYKVKGSTSSFLKKKSYDIVINSSPISVSVKSVREISSGQEFDLNINIKSNSQSVLKNVLLRADYPFGFKYISSSQNTISGTNVWKIGDVEPGSEKTLTIRGVMEGEDSDIRAFRFGVGAQSVNDPKMIGTYFMSLQQDISIKKPFISMDIIVDGDDSAGDYAVNPKQNQRIKITYINNLPTSVNNANFVAKISGSAFNNSTVYPESGYYNSANNQIIWNRQTTNSFGNIEAGSEGSITFSLVPKDTTIPQNYIINPYIDISVSVTGDRTGEVDVPTSLKAIANRRIKISTVPTLSTKLLRSVGPFTNSGPIPPKVDQKTTYTVIWRVDNTTNSISNGRVTSSLPAYVKWLGQVSPSGENVSYDSNSGSILWNVGSVGAKTVSSGRYKEVAFQISLEPSVSQLNQSPILINKPVFTGVDDYTGAQLTTEQDFLTTRFNTDPIYRSGDEVVGQ